jgi:hypothetical protein
MALAGNISGVNFFWFLLREHKDKIEELLFEYLNYEVEVNFKTSCKDKKPIDWTTEEHTDYIKNFCSIDAKEKFQISMEKNRLLSITFDWTGQVTFKNSKRGVPCPITGYDLQGNLINLPLNVCERPDYKIHFFMYQYKKYEPGDTSICNHCKNQLTCATLGTPKPYAHFVSNLNTSTKV